MKSDFVTISPGSEIHSFALPCVSGCFRDVSGSEKGNDRRIRSGVETNRTSHETSYQTINVDWTGDFSFTSFLVLLID